MTLKEEYQKAKIKHPNKIIIIKSGIFYTTFYQDAHILNYLFNYQIKDNKVGFPIKNLDKVLFKLREEKINYIIIEDNHKYFIHESYKDEDYKSLTKLTSKYINEVEKNNNLLNQIELLLKISPNNYQKILNFINEL